eukprot:scaffold55220_cov19-Prasinocladus_malaysianus.AAC.6
MECLPSKASMGRATLGGCAPCHLPNLVTGVDGVNADLSCELWNTPSLADPMLLATTAAEVSTFTASTHR